jgi:3-dehydroquinate synthase
MVNLKIELNGKTYPLFIGTHILGSLAEIYQLYGYKSRAAVITDFNINNSYFNIVYDNFKKIGVEIVPIYLRPQQVRGGLLPVQQIAQRLAEIQFQPDETIISLGGSSVGNISAFVAQMIYGGVAYLQIPTTLAAQVVQSVDPFCRATYGSIVNLFSIRYERNLVWSDIALLKSLPEQNFTSGLGYIIQYACLQDNGIFEFFEKNLKQILDLNLDIIEETVFRCCQARYDWLRKYQFEQRQLRQKIFGEFFAAILNESTRDQIKFGIALLFGMLIEGIVAFRVGIFDGPYFERFYELLKRVPFYHFRNRFDKNSIIECLNNRFSQQKRPFLALPQQIGKFTSYNAYELPHFLAALDFVFSE